MKTETKSVRIETITYDKVREYCDENGLKISRWISKILAEKLNDIEKK